MVSGPEPRDNKAARSLVAVVSSVALVSVWLWLGMLTPHDLVAGFALTLVHSIWNGSQRPSAPTGGNQSDE